MTSSPLAGITVSELGGTVTSSAAGAVLARLGAAVTQIEFASSALPSNAPQAARLRQRLDRGKAAVMVDYSPDADFSSAPPADITIVDVSGWSANHGAAGIDAYVEQVSERNRGVWVTASPYGITGPRRGWRGTELTQLASGGLLHYSPFHRSPGSMPLKPAGYQASLVAGHVAGIAGLIGLRSYRDDGAARHLDVSVQESVLVTGVFLECAHVLFECPGSGGAFRYAPPRGLYSCTDGDIYIVAIAERHWRGCVAALGNPAWARDIHTTEERLRHGAQIDAAVSEWASGLDADTCVERLQKHGVAATRVASPRDLQHDAGVLERGAFELFQGDRVPKAPVETTVYSLAADDIVRDPRSPLRVVDAGHILAVPLASSLLGAAGCEVIKLEDPARLDMYRQKGPFCQGHNDPELSAYFAGANYSKFSYAFDPSSRSGLDHLHRLLSASDVVLENLSAAHRQRLGLVPTQRGLPGKLTQLVSCSGFGRLTPRRDHRAFGTNVHAAGGLVYLTRDAAGVPQSIGTSFADPVAALWMVLLVLAEDLAARRTQVFMDLSMVEVMAYQATEYFGFEVDGAQVVSAGNQLERYCPHGVFQCRGTDSWIAVAVTTDAEWNSLRRALGDPVDLRSSHFDDEVGRQRNQHAIESALGSLFASCDRDALVARLQHHDVAAAGVLSAGDLVNDEHLLARGAFPTLTHPRWGTRRVIAPPWRDMADGRPSIIPTPTVGQHNERIDRLLDIEFEKGIRSSQPQRPGE